MKDPAAEAESNESKFHKISFVPVGRSRAVSLSLCRTKFGDLGGPGCWFRPPGGQMCGTLEAPTRKRNTLINLQQDADGYIRMNRHFPDAS
ncbi:hypothetical protein AHiyo6_31670 [Arthrobacter sp. Hiyo6]|nr:hypothetical protein AHiyo6_31670 [Arthrobacter sp. Hiyo6]